MRASEPVILSADEYAALLNDSEQLSALLQGVGAIDYPRSPIDRDPEIAAFLAARFGKQPVGEILEDCLKAFGWARTPSRSAAYRFVWRLRRRERELDVSSNNRGK